MWAFIGGNVGSILSFIAGWLVSHHYYKRERKDSRPMEESLAAVLRKTLSGALTTDGTTREIIKALEKGALRPDSMGVRIDDYRFCPECNFDVEIVDTWSTEHGEAGGGTMKCKRCSWSRAFEF